MLAVVSSGTLHGIEALPVQVEVNSGERGEPKIILVGLPDAAVKESNDRVVSALSNSGFSRPHTRTTINLAPGNIRKEGSTYDLPIALGILASTGQIQAPDLDDYLIGGELSLSGETRPIKGALAMTILAREQGKAGLLLPPQSAHEAALVEGVAVYSVGSLGEACDFLTGRKQLAQCEHSKDIESNRNLVSDYDVDFSEIKGQQSLIRAVEVAVAGGHNILMIGPPGSGKSMVAKRIPTIMPEPTLEEFLEILSVYSAAGKTLSKDLNAWQRPFRSPHHTISDVGLLGGGTIPGPGDLSLAHNGVLFLDELPEFKRSALEVLRQPLEDGEVTISRSAGRITLPCSTMLVAAMNPCPCGYLSDQKRECRCTVTQIQRYRARISGPLLDRIDIHSEVPSLTIEEMRNHKPAQPSKAIRERVRKSRDIQIQRFGGTKTHCNARMSHAHIQKYCPIDDSLGTLLQQAMDQLRLSARAYDRILKVSRTIADLAESENIEATHLLEAIHYRSLDRSLFY